MPHGPSVEETFGSISLLSDTIPKHESRKLDSGGARLLASGGDFAPDALAGDTTRAIRLLRDAVARIDDPFTIFYPLRAMAPQRVLLAELLVAAERDTVASRQWARSFRTSRNVADHFFADWSRGAPAPSHDRP